MKSFGDHIDQQRLYTQEIAEFAYITKNTHTIQELGVVDGSTIYLFKSNTPNGILVTAGWQGDEPAGWQSCKNLCETIPDASFIPIVSPSCFISRQHFNDYSRNVDASWPDVVTAEGKVLHENIELLTTLSSKAFFSLQEDRKRGVSYFYTWGDVAVDLKQSIHDTMNHHIPQWNSGDRSAPDRGLFGAYIVSCGSKQAFQIETPADGTYPLAKRIECQSDTVRTIVQILKV
jgi:hypothetical protein